MSRVLSPFVWHNPFSQFIWYTLIHFPAPSLYELISRFLHSFVFSSVFLPLSYLASAFFLFWLLLFTMSFSLFCLFLNKSFDYTTYFISPSTFTYTFLVSSLLCPLFYRVYSASHSSIMYLSPHTYPSMVFSLYIFFLSFFYFALLIPSISGIIISCHFQASLSLASYLFSYASRYLSPHGVGTPVYFILPSLA